MQKIFLKTISATLITALMAHAQGDDPDFRREESFHRTYKKYNEAPTSEESWEKVLSGRSANTYSVQNKDTLWDISQTLFGDAQYWPKVWSFNTEDIQNPHEINPKQVIKFYPGTLAEAPTVGLAAKSDAPEAMPTHVLEKTEEGKLEGIKIPPPKKISRPVVKKLPKSLPLYRLGVVNKPRVDFEVSGARVKYAPAPKYLSVYISDAPQNTQGEVVEMELPEEQTSGEHEQLIVRVSNAAERHFVIIKDDLRISDPTSGDEDDGRRGTIIEVQGEIELGERVNEKENLFRAVVKKALAPIEVGAKLVPGKLTTFDSGATVISTSVQAKVIGGEYHRFEQKMFGIDNIIFLNAGAKEGLQEGSTLQIYLNERLRKPNTRAVANDRVIGHVKIIKLADHFATGYVIDSQSDIMVGDYAGGRIKPEEVPQSAESVETSEAPVPSNGATEGDEFELDFDAPSTPSAPPSNEGEAPAPAEGETDDFQL